LAGLSFSAQAKKKTLDGFWGEWEKFEWTDQKFDGKWKEKQTWKGRLCTGSYQYTTFLKIGVKRVDFDLKEGYGVVTADVENIYARAEGNYRSSATFCVPAGGWLGASIPWGRLKTEVHFDESGELKNARLKIVSTQVGRIEMGRYVPAWFEDFFTGVVNRALVVVWNSKLGSWLSEKVTEQARKKLEDVSL
jgi:hypothetical protein